MQERSFISSFKYFLQGAFILFLSLLLFFLAGSAYEKSTSRNHVNAFTKQRFEEYYAQPENTIDLLFLGSSHSYCTFDPEIFDQALGTNSWQLGTPSQHADTSYYVLLNALQTQAPDTVVMELYWDVLDDDFEMNQAVSFFEVCNDPNLVEAYYKEVFPAGEKAKYALPAIRHQQSYFSYRSSRLERAVETNYGLTQPPAAVANGVEYYQAKGYVYCDIVIPEEEFDATNQYKNLDGKDWKMSTVQKDYLDRIVALCQERNIRLLFVTAPIAPVSMDYIQNYDLIHVALASYAESAGVDYVDLNLVNEQTPFLTYENFRDDAHLNHSGVIKTDQWYLDYLRAKDLI